MKVSPQLRRAAIEELARRRLAQKIRIDLETPPSWFHEQQLDAWQAETSVIAICAGWQSGKALDVSTPIPTPHGFAPMGNLQSGDTVVGRDGKAIRVVGVSPVMLRECYRLVFDDATEIIADEDHQWFAESWRQRANRLRDERLGKLPKYSHCAYGKVVTTAEMVKSGTVAKDGGAEWSIPLPDAAEYPEAVLPIPPYVLGCWLGDGTSRNAGFTCADPETIERIESLGVSCTENEANSERTGAASYYILGRDNQSKGRMVYSWIAAELRKLGLIQNKHIPEIYLTASIEQRTELIKGLLDTDGYCDDQGHIEFCSIREDLAMGFAELVRSLGIKCRVKVARSAHYGKDCGLRYRAMVYTGTPLFHLPRKLAKQRTPTRPDVYARYIRQIEPVGQRLVKCISVDAQDELYLAGRDYIVTHNTVALCPWLLREIQRKGPGDYGAFSSTYKLLSRKFLPELRKSFKQFADFRASDMQFVFTETGSRKLWGANWSGEPTVIQLGYAENPDSLESATLKAVVWDEPGQRLVPEQSFLTVHSRLMVNQGRMCLASRPYEFGWYQRLVQGNDPDVTVVQFPSWANPVNPPKGDEYWQKLKDKLQDWQFTILYEGKFERPAGAIFDNFDYKRHIIPQREVPKEWERVAGLDFGGINTAAVCGAIENRHLLAPRIVIHADYWPKQARDEKDHAKAITGLSGRTPRAFGGSHQESGWRTAYTLVGLPVLEPQNSGSGSVEVRIQAIYSMLASGTLVIMEGCTDLIDQLTNYTRKVVDGEVVDEIDDKASFHLVDALGYLCVSNPGPNVVIRQANLSVTRNREDIKPERHPDDVDWDDDRVVRQPEPVRRTNRAFR